MTIKDLTYEQLKTIGNINPECAAINKPEFVKENEIPADIVNLINE